MTWPTPELPLMLYYPSDDGRAIPAMKNNRDIIHDTQGVPRSIKNARVQAYLKMVGPLLSAQWNLVEQIHDFEPVPLPYAVEVYVQVVLYRPNPKKLPRQDGDNIYTTLQETLPGLVLQNDKQVADHHVRAEYTPNKALHHALLWLWVIEGMTSRQKEDAYRHVVDTYILDFPDRFNIKEMPLVDT